MSKLRKYLAIVLALSMSFTHISFVYAETDSEQENNDSTESVQLEIEELDPSSLGVEKLGNYDDVEEEETELIFNNDDIVRVSIVLDKPSTIDAGYSTKNIGSDSSAVNYRESVMRQQTEVTKNIEAKLSKTLDVKWNLTLAVNIISAEVKYSDINKIRLVSGVKKVFLENRYEALKEETRRISKSVAVIEHEHGKKIDTLIDITLGYLEEQNFIKKSLKSQSDTLDNHSNRIWNLESKLGII